MRYYFVLLLCLFALSCNTSDKPEVIPAATMEKMLVDMHYAEAYCTMVNDSSHQVRNKNMDSLAVYYKAILNHYKVTEDQLAQSVNWYKQNPEALDSVYAKAIPELGKLEAFYQKMP